MRAELNDYLVGLWDRYSDAEAQEIADKIVDGWRTTLEELSHLLGSDINVQDVVMDCIHYQTSWKHGRDPIRRKAIGPKPMPFGQTFEPDKMTPAARRMIELSDGH